VDPLPPPVDPPADPEPPPVDPGTPPADPGTPPVDPETPDDPGDDPEGGPPPSETCEEEAPAAGLEAGEPLITAAAGDIVLRPADSATLVGNWIIERDCRAAGGAAVINPDMDLPRTAAAAEPTDYFDMTFEAEAGKPYRLWIRARAEGDSWKNDSVSIQFSGAVDALGTPIYGIGTMERTLVSLEDCVSCGMADWGWQDNGFGEGVLGPEIYFAASGPQTIRVQRREDGISIDQIVLSSTAWLTSPPGLLKKDATIVAVQ
jgi:hypothetical protein